MTVTTARVQVQTLPQVAEVQGTITPWQEAIISARVGGLTLVELQAQVGDRVKRGQLLARFDARTVNAELNQAKANLAHASANAVQSNANRDRTVRMQSRGGVSEQELQTAQTQAEMAEAQRKMAEAQLTAQQIRLQDTDVLAVDDGVISARTATLGQVAQPGTELFRLIRQERLEWQAELNSQQLARVRAGQSVTINLPNGSQVRGTIRQLAPSLNSNSRLGVAYVDLQTGSTAHAGMYVSGQIDLEQKESLVVPAEAVVLRDGRSSVFIMSGDNKVVQTPVETGRRNGNMIEITQGLSAGDAVAVRGAGFLADGDHVKQAPELGVQASNLPDAEAVQ
ncbi:MAG TPA: efflux RND transporter periplasmic adaptor subunit [Dongiaceae bacterium]|nr:efflux RND transporter periplasmic adaptor subunit [Dongiaceae bacterium]